MAPVSRKKVVLTHVEMRDDVVVRVRFTADDESDRLASAGVRFLRD